MPASGYRGAVNDPTACVLVSASCTTGWLDWIHGELWLCPDGLLRRSLGPWATVKHGRGPTIDPAHRPTRTFATAEIEGVVAADRRNRWIPWTAASTATLTLGSWTSLRLQLHSGDRATFLWLTADRGVEMVQRALEVALPGRVEVTRRRFG